jgi:alanyl-tRNA synthetase
MSSEEEISINNIRNTLMEEFTRNSEFHKVEPTGLTNPNIPVAFNPSAGFLEIKQYVHGDEPLPIKKFYVTEKCCRIMDQNIIGTSSRHLSFFEMYAYFVAGSQNSSEMEESLIEKCTKLLEDTLQLDKNKIYITIFGGGEIANIKEIIPDTEAKRLWEKNGFPERNIILTEGLRNFVANFQWGYAGTSYEIFYKTDDGLLEVASTNKYKYRVQHKQKHGQEWYELIPSTNFAFGTGFGLERVSTILNNENDIFDIPELKEGMNQVQKYLHVSLEDLITLDKEHIKQIVDSTRAIMFIMSEGIKPYKKPSRSRILKKIIKNTLEEINYLGLHPKSQEIIEGLFRITNEQYKSVYDLRIGESLDFLRAYIPTVPVNKKYSHLLQTGRS